LARLARRAGVRHGVVQDKLFLPGIRKLKRLVDAGFFGRIVSVRGEFGYWVFEGDRQEQPPQRPSWNYRKEEGGGITVDMFAHWRYLLDHTFGAVKAVQCTGATHIPERVDERGRRYVATADDAAYATFVLDGPQGEIMAQFNSSWATRVYRDDLLQIQVDGTLGSAVATLRGCKTQQRAATPRPVWNPDVPNPLDFREHWQEVPDTGAFDNAFKVQWELFLRHVAADEPFAHDFHEGAKGVQLAELALQSCVERRWVDVRPLLDVGVHSYIRLQHRLRAAWPTPPRTSCATRWRMATPSRARRSTGTRRSPIAATSGRSASAWPKRWTRRSAAWDSTGRRRAS
jgi:predicted dehydrogenase